MKYQMENSLLDFTIETKLKNIVVIFELKTNI